MGRGMGSALNILKILQIDPNATVQDRGRFGLRRYGVSASGPMDAPSLRIANALVGNGDDCACIEMAGFGGRFTVRAPTHIAVTGVDVEIRVNDQKIWPWESRLLDKGEILTIGGFRGAVWGYLALSGGIDVAPVLGSRATHLRSGLGGWQGRRLRVGDELPLGNAPILPRPRVLKKNWQRSSRPIRVIAGPQADYFSSPMREEFVQRPFVISSLRDRMGQILEDHRVISEKGYDIVSDGTCPGSIQIPASGKPIVLMAEAPTTGGYPKIATVASVDLARLAQIPSGQRVKFSYISSDQAEEEFIISNNRLNRIIEEISEDSSAKAYDG